MLLSTEQIMELNGAICPAIFQGAKQPMATIVYVKLDIWELSQSSLGAASTS